MKPLASWNGLECGTKRWWLVKLVWFVRYRFNDRCRGVRVGGHSGEGASRSSSHDLIHDCGHCCSPCCPLLCRTLQSMPFRRQCLPLRLLVCGRRVSFYNAQTQALNHEWQSMGWSKCIEVRGRDGKEIDRAEKRDSTLSVVLTCNSTTWVSKARVRVCKQWFLSSLPPSESEGILFRGRRSLWFWPAIWSHEWAELALGYSGLCGRFVATIGSNALLSI